MKMSIEISRCTTLNIGSYNTIKPSISVKLDDIPIEQISDKTKIIQNLVDNLWIEELLNMNDELKTIFDIGYNEYVNVLEGKRKDIKDKTKMLYKFFSRFNKIKQ